MATYSSILAWRIPWTGELAAYSPWECKESDTTHTAEFRSWLCHRGLVAGLQPQHLS